MRIILFAIALTIINITTASAQMASTREAQYLATVKAVADYKINDEKYLRDIEKLRKNRLFNQKLQEKINRLQNSRSKDGRNQKVLRILEDAGRQLDKVLE